jgi:hypothetical protein
MTPPASCATSKGKPIDAAWLVDAIGSVDVRRARAARSIAFGQRLFIAATWPQRRRPRGRARALGRYRTWMWTFGASASAPSVMRWRRQAAHRRA